MAAPGLGTWGAFEGQHTFWGGGGKIEFHEISPPPRCQNFWLPGFFSIHFFRSFFPDISNFFPDLYKLSRPTRIFHGPTKNFSQTYQKCNFLSNISKIFTLLPIQLRCFNNIWPFLVQSFFETSQYCDQWRKFTSVSQLVSRSVGQSASRPIGQAGRRAGGQSVSRSVSVQISNQLLECHSYKVLIKITWIY